MFFFFFFSIYECDRHVLCLQGDVFPVQCFFWTSWRCIRGWSGVTWVQKPQCHTKAVCCRYWLPEVCVTFTNMGTSHLQQSFKIRPRYSKKKKKNLEDSLYMYCVWPERHIVLYYTFNKMLLSCTVVVQEGRFRPLMAAAAINASSHRHGHLVYKDLVWTASLSCLLLPKCCPTL